MVNECKKVLVISGATASGKSELVLKIAEEKNIAIINADSLQIYQGLPILSSQPSISDQKKAPHFLYSHFQPQESCSVGKWLELVKEALDEVYNQKKIPVIVGGSGMYISKLIDGIAEIPVISGEVKKSANELYEKIGHHEFQQKFGEGKIIDKQRLIRACEVFLQTQKTIFFWQNQQPKKILPHKNFTDFLHINLDLQREKIYQNCNLRFEKMLKNGALEEVQSFVNRGFESDWQITKTLGFHEIADFLANKISYQKMIEVATQKTRNYAKRQLTWFRNQLAQKIVFNETKSALEFLKNEI